MERILDGKYRIVGVLGRGGMGVVYVAENLNVRRKVAIKVLHKEAGASSDAIVRFEREAQAAGTIGSDHIVEVLDLGTTEDGERFMVMEYLEGETLKQRISRGRVTPEEMVDLLCQLLDGLEAAHAANIVHRDLKPDNVFLQREKAGRRDWVKILDFGISKFNALVGEEGQVTRAGMVMGTPFYMSPEQARASSDVDARSDLYSVAVILYEALTGQVPFRASTFAELLFKIVFEVPPPPSSLAPSLDAALCAIMVKGMDRSPALRFQSASEFRQTLLAWRAGAQRSSDIGSLRRSSVTRLEPLRPHPSKTPSGELDSATQVWAGTPPAQPTPVNAPSPAAADVRAELPARAPKRGLFASAVVAAALVVCGVVALVGLGKKNAPSTQAAHESAHEAPIAQPPVPPSASAETRVADPSDTSASQSADPPASVSLPRAHAGHGKRLPASDTAAPALAPSSAPVKPDRVVTDYGY